MSGTKNVACPARIFFLFRKSNFIMKLYVFFITNCQVYTIYVENSRAWSLARLYIQEFGNLGNHFARFMAWTPACRCTVRKSTDYDIVQLYVIKFFFLPLFDETLRHIELCNYHSNTGKSAKTFLTVRFFLAELGFGISQKCLKDNRLRLETIPVKGYGLIYDIIHVF